MKNHENLQPKSAIFKRFLRALVKTRTRKILLAIFLMITLYLVYFFVSFDPGIFNSPAYSTTFYDRNGKPLRTYFSQEETYGRPCRLSEVSPHFLRAIVLIEDKTFYSHKGIVLSSLFRAARQNISEQKVISGGSTITMQLAKMVFHHHKRTIFNKVAEIFLALKFEMHMSKSQILEHYINRLPFGNMVYGIDEAARFYFGKAPSQLSLNQAIYLALIPKSPSRYNPVRHMPYLEKRWKMILDMFKQRNHITEDEYRRALSEGITFRMKQHPFLAPHFIELVKERFTGKKLPGHVYTTLDYRVQQVLEGIVREHLVRLGSFNVQTAAAVIIDNQNHQVIGFLGSPDYFSEPVSGFVNLATSLRQPGSTLKPFVYGLALQSGYSPSTIVPDIKFPARGGFFPANHDGREHGPLRLRVALACSYNIPAFYLAMKLTPSRVIQKLQSAGFTSLKGESGFYGETIALGSGEVTLLDLTAAYSAFANQGILYSPCLIKNEPVKMQPVFDATTAFLIWHILSDPAARFPSFGYDSSMNLPFPVAIKTGTSKGYRDKWAIGVNSRFTIGVWLGNPSGQNMHDLSEVGSASTVLRDLFLAVQEDWTQGAIPPPPGVEKYTICALSGQLASEFCPDTVDEYFSPGHVPQRCTWHVRQGDKLTVHYPELYRKWAFANNPTDTVSIEPDTQPRISFPQQGNFFYISDAISLKDQQITFEVIGLKNGQMVDYYLNNQLIQRLPFPHFPWWQLQKGDYTLTVKIDDKTLDTISFAVR